MQVANTVFIYDAVSDSGLEAISTWHLHMSLTDNDCPGQGHASTNLMCKFPAVREVSVQPSEMLVLCVPY